MSLKVKEQSSRAVITAHPPQRRRGRGGFAEGKKERERRKGGEERSPLVSLSPCLIVSLSPCLLALISLRSLRALGASAVKNAFLRRALLSLSILLFLFSPSISQSPDAWPQFRGNYNNTGVSPSQPPADLKLLWTYDAGDLIESSAAIAAGTVYVGTGKS